MTRPSEQALERRMMLSQMLRYLSAPAFVRLLALAVAEGVLAYWALARTPVQPVSSSIDMAMTAMSALFALISGLLALAALLLAWDERGDIGWGRVAAATHLLRRLPAWVFATPVAMSASYVAARMALTPHVRSNYWPALGLWLGAMLLFLASFVPARSLPRSMPRSMPRLRRPSWSGLVRSEVLLLLVLTAVALAIRVVKLDAAPMFVHVDEEAIGLDTLNVLEGHLRNMFAQGWGGLPSMAFFIHAPALKVLGENIVSLRTTSAVVGAAAVPMVYLLLRDLFGKGPALVGAVFLVGYHLHLQFSRTSVAYLGGDALFVAVPLYFAFRASRYERHFDFGATGLTTGLALYLSHGTRVVPLIILAYLGYLVAFERGFLRRNVANLSMTFLAFFLAAMPLGAYWLTHQSSFWARIGTVGIFQSGWFDAEVDMGRSPLSILWDQALHSFGGFVYYPESSSFTFYDKSVPLVFGLAIVPFIAGFVYSVLHIDDRRYVLLLIAFVIPTVLGGTLTVGPNNGQRLLTTIPSIVGFVAVGTWQLADWVLAWRRALVGPVAIVVAVGLAAINAQFFFEAATHDTRFGAASSKEAVQYIQALPPETRIYWYGAPRISAHLSPLSLHDRHLVEVFELAPTPVPPVEEPSPSVYIFFPYREAELSALESHCPGGAEKEVSFRQQKLFISYELMEPNTCAPEIDTPDDFADARVLPSAPMEDFTATTTASAETGEPKACRLGGNTVWYAFTPAEDTSITAYTDGSGFDTVLAVYEGTSLESLDLVECNDDYHGVSSHVEFRAKGDETYFFQIGGSTKNGGAVPAGIVSFHLQESGS